MNKFFLLFTILIFATYPLFEEADAQTFTISDQASCQAIGGSWSGNTCTISGMHSPIFFGDKWVIPVGITLEFASGSSIINLGTIENYGTIRNNGGTITNVDTLTNFGPSAQIINDNDGTIHNNGGTINNDAHAKITNTLGLVRNNANGIINNNIHSIIDNFDTIGSDGSGTITNSFGAFINNHGGINSGGLVDNFGFITNTQENAFIDHFGTIKNNDHAVIDNFGRIDNDANSNLVNDGLIRNHFLIGVNPTGTITNNDTIENDDTIINNGHIINNGALDNDFQIFNRGILDNFGEINVLDLGFLNNQNNANINNHGFITIDLGGIIGNNGATITNNNSGVITIFEGRIENVGGVINNNFGGEINNTFGEINNNSGGIIDNDGGIIENNSDGEINNTFGEINNNSGGRINNNGGIINILVGDINNNHGTIINIGGRIQNNSGDIINDIGGIIHNFGGSIVNVGDINNNGGIIINDIGGIIENIGQGIIIENNGEIDNFGEINNFGGRMNNFGEIRNQCGGTLNNFVPFMNNLILEVCDSDSDNIADFIEPGQDVGQVSHVFRYINPQGVETFGVILERGDQNFLIHNAGDPSLGVKVVSNSSGSAASGLIRACNSALYPIVPGIQFIGTCGSVNTIVIQGPLSIQFNGEDETMANAELVNGDNVTFFPESFTFINQGENSIEIEIEGGETITIEQGNTVNRIVMDIKPNSNSNKVNCKSGNGVVPVALFADQSVLDKINVTQLYLNDSPISEKHGKIHFEDIGEAILHLNKSQVCDATDQLPLKELVATTLVAQVTADESIEGTDLIQITKR